MRSLISFSYCYRSGIKASSSSDKKSKPVPRLSHDLFASGSFEDDGSVGDFYSPLERSKEISKTATAATPSTSNVAKATSSGTDLLFGEGMCMFYGTCIQFLKIVYMYACVCCMLCLCMLFACSCVIVMCLYIVCLVRVYSCCLHVCVFVMLMLVFLHVSV